MNRINFNKIAMVLSMFFYGFSAQAATASFTAISQGDLEEMTREASTNFMHTSVSGASSLGTVFGFQFGLVGGITKTPNINTFAQRGDANANVSQIPHGGLLGVVSIPAGVSFEGLILPSVGPSDFKVRNTSLGVKWTLTQLLLELPVDLAVKGFYTKASMETKQTISGATQNITMDDKAMGLEVLVSKNFEIVEPYFGLIHAKATNDISYTGSGTIFNTNFTAGQSASANVTSTGYMFGAELKLLFFHAGAEFTHLFGANRYTAKLAFSF